jgi:hypothetical protein
MPPDVEGYDTFAFKGSLGHIVATFSVYSTRSRKPRCRPSNNSIKAVLCAMELWFEGSHFTGAFVERGNVYCPEAIKVIRECYGFKLLRKRVYADERYPVMGDYGRQFLLRKEDEYKGYAKALNAMKADIRHLTPMGRIGIATIVILTREYGAIRGDTSVRRHLIAAKEPLRTYIKRRWSECYMGENALSYFQIAKNIVEGKYHEDVPALHGWIL